MVCLLRAMEELLKTFHSSPDSIPHFINPPVGGDLSNINKDAQIGPNVYCGKHTQIASKTILSNCYLFENIQIESNSTIKSSIIGPNIKILPNTHYFEKIILQTGIYDLY
jgi:NDP-sugar pyrophosphorylase family protein